MTATMTTETVRSFCRFCEAACGILVEVDRGQDGNERVARVRGDPDHPLSAGYTCPKGRALGAWHHHPERLDVPQVRAAGGALTATSWDHALGDLAATLGALIDAHGPDSVGVLLATGSAFDSAGRRMAERLWQRLGSRSTYTSASIDTPCKPLVSRLMTGFPGFVPTLDLDRSRLALFIGCNPVVSHGHLNGLPNPVVNLRRLTEGGRELWVIDPRRTETARLATGHLAPRPGTDHVLLAHLVRELLRDGADHEYLATYADRDDVATVAALVEPYTLAVVADRCDVPAADVIRLVAAIRAHGRLAGQTGTGATMARSANLTEWLLWVLHVVTGSFDQHGGTWFNPGYLRQLDRRPLAAAGDEPAPGPRSRPELRDWIGEMPCAALCDEIEAGHLRALVVLGGNPVRALPRPDRVAAALGRLDALAVLDVIATDTTAVATHVLPVAGQLERADLPLTIDQFVVALTSQYTPAVVAPGAERRPAWWVFAELADRLGRSVLPEGLTPATACDDDLLSVVADRSRGSFAELRAGVGWAEPVYGWVIGGALPNGRWRLAPEQLVAQFRATADEPPASMAMVPRREVRQLNSQPATGEPSADPPILVGELDARAAGIADGDTIVVTSSHGEVTGRAAVTAEVRQGVVSMTHGRAAPNVSRLTSDTVDVDALTGMVRQGGLPVTIRRG